jgi:uncharacterized damage-inducible protein DinB
MIDEQTFLDNALTAWLRHHNMTYSLLAQITEEQLQVQLPRPGLNTFAKHFEEMVHVQHDYARAFSTHILKFSEDNVYTGAYSKQEIHGMMQEADLAIKNGIAACPVEQRIDIFGMQGTRADLVQTLLHHELFHHGQFSIFSYEMKFNLPQDWRDFWWIPAYF